MAKAEKFTPELMKQVIPAMATVYNELVTLQKRNRQLERQVVQMKAGLDWYRSWTRGTERSDMQKEIERLHEELCELRQLHNSVMIERAQRAEA
jgi:phage shock protein A